MEFCGKLLIGLSIKRIGVTIAAQIEETSMSVEFTGSGFRQEPFNQESKASLADLEKTMQAVRSSIQAENSQRSDEEIAAEDLSADDISQAAEAYAELAQNINRDLRFNVNNDLERPIIRVIERSSGDMIRQIPSEEFVDLALKLRELNADRVSDKATGLLIDSRV